MMSWNNSCEQQGGDCKVFQPNREWTTLSPLRPPTLEVKAPSKGETRTCFQRPGQADSLFHTIVVKLQGWEEGRVLS